MCNICISAHEQLHICKGTAFAILLMGGGMDGLEQDRLLLEALVRHTGETPTAIAREIEVSPTMLTRPYAGASNSRLSRSTIDKLRSHYPDFPGWAEARVSSRQMPFHGAAAETNRLLPRTSSPPGRPTDDDMDDGTAEVAMYDLAFGMGGTYIYDVPVDVMTARFPRSFLRQYTKSPASKLFFAHGIGDSMAPSIGDNDMVLIDTAQNTPRMSDKVWAISVGQIGMIKRLRFQGADGGEVIIVSDNPAVSDYPVAVDELQIIGRVVAIVQSM